MISLILALASSCLASPTSSNTIPFVNGDSCHLPTAFTSFNKSAIMGTWYPYQHQPDFVEGAITLGCKCVKSVLSPIAGSEDLTQISNVCNYFTTNGPVVDTKGTLSSFTADDSSNGLYKFTLYGRDEHYQVLDITDDGEHMLATVCNNGFGLALRSFCVYYFSKTPPTGETNLDASILQRFEGKAQELGIYKPENMRFDYKNSVGCTW